MTDRELLELAAKAVGIFGEWVDYYACDDYYYKGNSEGIFYTNEDGQFFVWNPLTDDGDALWLAVQLHLTIYQWTLSECCVCNESGTINESVSYGKDQLAATRRAIVLAATELGKGME